MAQPKKKTSNLKARVRRFSNNKKILKSILHLSDLLKRRK